MEVVPPADGRGAQMKISCNPIFCGYSWTYGGDDIVAANAVAVMVVNIGAIAMRGSADASGAVVTQSTGFIWI